MNILKVKVRLAGWIERYPDELPVEAFNKETGFSHVGTARRVEQFEFGSVAELTIQDRFPGHTVMLGFGTDPNQPENVCVMIIPPDEDDRDLDHQVPIPNEYT